MSTRRVGALLAALAIVVLATLGFGRPAAAADEPCELVDPASVGRLLGPVGTPEESTAGSLPSCRIPIGTLTLEVIDASGAPDAYDAQFAAHPAGSTSIVDDYVDRAFFGWNVGAATDFVAQRGDQVTILRLTGVDRSGDFVAADPTASAPDGDVSGSEVGSSLWVLMTEAFAGADGVEDPAADDLSGLWRTTDITPCAPQSELSIRVSEFADDDGSLQSIKVAGDSCLENQAIDFEGTTVDGEGTGVSFGSVGAATPGAGTPYELSVDSPTQVTLTGAAGALQYTLVYERLSWPGLDAADDTSTLLGIPSPTEAVTARNVALTGAVSGVLLLIVVLPTTLFNSALEANLDHYRAMVEGWRRKLRGSDRRESVDGGGRTFWGSARGVVAYLVIAGLLFSLLQPGWGVNTATAISLIGFTAGVVVTSVLGVTATVVYLWIRHHNGRGRPRVEPTTLAIAFVFVLASRVVGFVPGYMYGVLVAWAAVQEPDESDKGRIVALGSAITLIAGVVAWFLIPTFREMAGARPNVLEAVPLSVVSGTFVSNVEILAIGLIPLRFLPGHTLKAYNQRLWALLWASSGVLFVLVLLRPGLVSGGSRNVTGTIVLVVVASAFALAFWAYESRRTPTAPGSDSAAPLPPPPPSAEAPAPQ